MDHPSEFLQTASKSLHFTPQLKIFDYLSLLLVSIVWGSTNALMKRFATSISMARKPPIDNDTNREKSITLRLFENLWNLVRNWKFFMTFLCNQSGSILFYWLLSGLPLTVVVPVVNALTFLFTAVTGCALGEEKPNFRTFIGAGLIVIGIALCIFD